MRKSSGKLRQTPCRKVFGFTKNCRESFPKRQFPTQSFWLHFKIKDSQNLQRIKSSFGLKVLRWRNATALFSILPDVGQMSFSLGDRAPDSPEGIWTNKSPLNTHGARLQLGIDRSEFIKTNIASSGEWGISFPRQVDGIQFYNDSEGFSFQQFGKEGKIRNFCLTLAESRTRTKQPDGQPAANHRLHPGVQNAFAAKRRRTGLFSANQKSGQSNKTHYYKNHALLQRRHVWRSADKQ